MCVCMCVVVLVFFCSDDKVDVLLLSFVLLDLVVVVVFVLSL